MRTDKQVGSLTNAPDSVKILEVGTFPPPYNGWSTRIAAVKDGLENAGHICIALNIGENRRIPSPDYECVRSGWEYFRKLWRYGRRGYLFHIHTNGEAMKGFVVTLVAYAVSLLTFRRPVLTFHAGIDQVYFPHEKSRLMFPIQKFFFAVAKAVICNNAEVAKRIMDYGVAPRKVFPIAPFSRQYVELPARELGGDMEAFLNGHTPVVLTYVENRPEYAMDSLFSVAGKLAKMLPRFGLIVVGATGEKEVIDSAARSAGLADRYIHLGAVEHAKFLALLQRVDLYLRSNKTEGTSTSIREALYFGVPVVANALAAHPEGVCGYSWGDSAAMYEAVESALAGTPPEQKVKMRADVPDTVSEEVEVLVRCAQGETNRQLQVVS